MKNFDVHTLETADWKRYERLLRLLLKKEAGFRTTTFLHSSQQVSHGPRLSLPFNRRA
jgi:hypothetical protein